MPAFGPSGYEIARLLTTGSGARPILPGGSAVCIWISTSSLFSCITFMRTRRSSSRRWMFSAMPFGGP